MGEEKRMTAEMEAEILAFTERHPNGYYGALVRELDAVRADLADARQEFANAFGHATLAATERDAAVADLAELVAALPRCGCGNLATRVDDDDLYRCDGCDPGAVEERDIGIVRVPSEDLPQAVVLRRLAERSKR